MKRFFLCVLLTAAVCFAAIPLLGRGQLMGTAEAADAYLYGNKNMPYVTQIGSNALYIDMTSGAILRNDEKQEFSASFTEVYPAGGAMTYTIWFIEDGSPKGYYSGDQENWRPFLIGRGMTGRGSDNPTMAAAAAYAYQAAFGSKG